MMEMDTPILNFLRVLCVRTLGCHTELPVNWGVSIHLGVYASHTLADSQVKLIGAVWQESVCSWATACSAVLVSVINLPTAPAGDQGPA